MVSVRDTLLAFASLGTFMIAAFHFLLVHDSNWANGPSRVARKAIFWFVSICYCCVLFVVVIWNRDVRRLLRFEIPEPMIIYYGFVFNILLSVAFPEQTLPVIVVCSLLAYSLFSLIEIVQPTISLGTLSLVLSVLSYKVCVTETFWLWRVLFGLQCIMLPLWFWNVTRTKRDDDTEDTTGTRTDDVDESERRPAPVPPVIQTTRRSIVDDDGGDQITVVDEEVPPEILTTGRRNVADEAGRPARMPTNEGVVLPLHEAGSAETGAQTPEIGRQELQAIIFDGRRDAVINVPIGVLRDVVEEVRDAIVGNIERDVAVEEVERDAAAEEVRDVTAQDVSGEAERDVAAEEVRDEVGRDVAAVAAQDVSDEVERDGAAEEVRGEVRDVASQDASDEVGRDVAAEEDEVERDAAAEEVRDVAAQDVSDEVERDSAAEEVRDEVRDVASQDVSDEVERDVAAEEDKVERDIAAEELRHVAAEEIRHVAAQDVMSDKVERDVAVEDVKDVASEDVRDNANVAEETFRDVCHIAAELLRDVVAQEEMRDAISVAMTVSTDVYGLIIAEVARDATIAEAVTRYVMIDLSIQIPDDEGGTEGQEDQTIEDKHLVDQGIDNASGSDCKGTKGIVLPSEEDQTVEDEPSVDHQEKDNEGGSGESGQRGLENPNGSK